MMRLVPMGSLDGDGMDYFDTRIAALVVGGL